MAFFATTVLMQWQYHLIQWHLPPMPLVNSQADCNKKYIHNKDLKEHIMAKHEPEKFDMAISITLQHEEAYVNPF